MSSLTSPTLIFSSAISLRAITVLLSLSSGTWASLPALRTFALCDASKTKSKRLSTFLVQSSTVTLIEVAGLKHQLK